MVRMFKFIILVSLLVISHLGDASMIKRASQEYRSSKALSNHGNDESFKAAYNKAVTQFPEFKYKTPDSTLCSADDSNMIRINFFSKSNPHGHKIHTDLLGETIKNSTYDFKKLTKIVVSPNHAEYVNSTEIVTAYLRHHKESVNVFTVNYEKFFGCEFSQYVKVYDYLADTIAKLVSQLHEYGTLLEDVHIIGFGLSAHVAGHVGKVLHPLKVGRITGLDPTGGLFDEIQWLGQLSAESADFVDIISTNTRKYGTKVERGNVHFYPNGGEVQPESDDLTSHLKAFGYFVESIVSTGSFVSKKAGSWSDYTNNNSIGKETSMGEYVSKRASGKYFLNVNPSPPYSTNGKYELSHKDQATFSRDPWFGMVQKSLNKESNSLEESLGEQVNAYNTEDARTDKPSGRRIYDYVRRASNQLETTSG